MTDSNKNKLDDVKVDVKEELVGLDSSISRPIKYSMSGGGCQVGSCMMGGEKNVDVSWQKRRDYVIPPSLLFTNGPLCGSDNANDIRISIQESISTDMLDDDLYNTLLDIVQTNAGTNSISSDDNSLLVHSKHNNTKKHRKQKQKQTKKSLTKYKDKRKSPKAQR